MYIENYYIFEKKYEFILKSKFRFLLFKEIKYYYKILKTILIFLRGKLKIYVLKRKTFLSRNV